MSFAWNYWLIFFCFVFKTAKQTTKISCLWQIVNRMADNHSPGIVVIEQTRCDTSGFSYFNKSVIVLCQFDRIQSNHSWDYGRTSHFTFIIATGGKQRQIKLLSGKVLIEVNVFFSYSFDQPNSWHVDWIMLKYWGNLIDLLVREHQHYFYIINQCEAP